ncbi:MAG TPA: sigma-70 family RNA polymerase sigma factor [Bacteroides sp.]|nr:sigma-70 family RNA polymerase sigma factor [Bacteroides sp.]
MDIHGETYHIDRIRAGDKQAFTWVVDTYKDMVYTICLRMLASQEDAREAAQEVFVKTYRSIHTFQERSKFSTWLYRVTYNHCISVIRKKVKVIDLVDQLPDETVDEEDVDGLQRISREERGRYLKMALESLPETDAVIVTLFYYEELTLEEIAGITGLTSSNIRVRLHRSRKKMYQVIRQYLKKETTSIM